MREAADRGLEGLLRNPQSLLLLAKVVGQTGEWAGEPIGDLPAGHDPPRAGAERGTSDRRLGPSCRANSSTPPGGSRRCSCSPGRTAIVLTIREPLPTWIPLSAHGEERCAAAAAALRTRLFEADEGHRRFRPAHANLAAYLAAKALRDLMKQGLPKRRVLSLLAADDGAPPTPLRGLVAWLAAMSPALRSQFIERDPVAVLLYGDIRNFTPTEKTLVLDEIARDPSRLYSERWPASALEGLASVGMKSALRRVLEDPDRSDSKQKTLEIVARALSFVPAPLALSADLPAMVVDENSFACRPQESA